MYVRPNYKYKKDLIEAVKLGFETEVFQPGLGDVPKNGKVCLEGPHYPKPHTWYAVGVMKAGKLISAK